MVLQPYDPCMNHGMTMNWMRLGVAVSAYRNHGYAHVEVPWMVPRRDVAVTFPHVPADDQPMNVGSAEQSFIHLARIGALSPGRYVACTPCFRAGDIGPLNQPEFMKVELWRDDAVSEATLHDMIADARDTMGSMAWGRSIDIVPTTEGYDLNLNGIEVGSYGIRSHDGRSWVYGTGLAEPRFGMALEA